MILIAGSRLVRDSGCIEDLDIVYLTFDPAKYLVVLKRRERIKEALERRLNVKVSFSPYFLLTPTVIGNLFIAITLLRRPKRGLNPILKLALSRPDKRWLLLHMAFATLGMLSAVSSRHIKKYCSMIAENLLYLERMHIPNTWKATIALGHIVARKRELHRLSALFLECLKYVDSSTRKINYKLLENAVIEYLGNVLSIDQKELLVLNHGISNAFRSLHVKLMKLITGKENKWLPCSSTFLLFIHPRRLHEVISQDSPRTKIITLLDECRCEIPVLSPLAHP